MDAGAKDSSIPFLSSWVPRCAVTPARALLTDFCYAACINRYIEVDHTSKTREKSVDENIDKFGQKGQQISITVVSNEKSCLFA